MSVMEGIMAQKTVRKRLEHYLAYILGTYCPDEDSLNNIITDILYIVNEGFK